MKSQTRWKIEEFHARIKQLTRKRILDRVVERKIQKNHIACAILVWNFLKRLAVKMGKTIDRVKHELLSNYLIKELQKPTIKFRGIFIL